MTKYAKNVVRMVQDAEKNMLEWSKRFI